MIKNSEYNFKQAVARSDIIKSPGEHLEEVHERFAMEEEKWCMIIGSNEKCPQMIKAITNALNSHSVINCFSLCY